MSIEGNIMRAEMLVGNAERRLTALRSIQQMNLTFDPSGVDYITFWVQDAVNTRETPVAIHAIRVTPDGGWFWREEDGHVRQGRWTELIDSLVADAYYPVAVRKPTNAVTHSLVGENFEPRQL